MKVRELMAVLAKADPDADVCCFSDDRSGAQTLENVAIWHGAYDRPTQENWLRCDTIDAAFGGDGPVHPRNCAP
jgi:hypothetical protein